MFNMDNFNFFLVVCVFFPQIVTGNPKPPQNIQVFISGSTVKFTWKETEPDVIFVYIEVVDSQGKKVIINSDSREKHAYVRAANSSFETTSLTPCEEYTIKVKHFKSTGRNWSDFAEKKFWLTDRNVTSNINTNVTVAWRTNYTVMFSIVNPRNNPIYNVDPGGNIINNAASTKYINNNKTDSVQDINITVIKANETDAGIYKSKKTYRGNTPFGDCSLLIITDKPKTPNLSLEDQPLFVGDNIRLTCKSEVQRWPLGIRSSLNYTFFISGQEGKRDDTLTIKNVSRLDDGTNISCEAVDDLGKKSHRSNTITLDIFYGPDDILISPSNSSITLKLDDTLGPITCSAKCKPECEVSWKKVTVGETATNRTLFVKSITKDDSGIYKCTAINPNKRSNLIDQNVSVTVLGKPTTPVLSVEDQNTFVGENIRFTCKSEVQRWPTATTTLSKLRYTFYGISKGKQKDDTLTIHNVSKSDNGTHLYCKAVDDFGMESEQSEIKTLDIFYGPEDVTVTPYAKSVSLVLGDNFGPITCSAKCNPKCNIRWEKDGTRKITTNGTLLAKRISEEDGGIYKCTATHPKNKSKNFSTIMKVTVLGKPTRPVLSLQPENPFDGDKIRLTCESRVQRWPIDRFSSLKYTFAGFQRERKEDGTLVIQHVSKQNTGTNISCTAVDDRGMDSEQSNIITLDVFYGPEKLNISPSEEIVTLISGEQLGPIICSSECNPKCKISWTTPKGINTSGTLYLNSATKVDGGIYQCTATHPVNTSKILRKNISVTVNYPPSITNVSVEVNGTFKTKNAPKYTFTEGDSVQVTFTTDGNPAVNLTVNSTVFASGYLHFNQSDHKYTMRLPRLQCESSGQFLVEAANGIKEKANWSAQFNIQCQPKNVESKEKIGTKIGANETISVVFVSNPNSSIEWYNKSINLGDWTIYQDNDGFKYNATSTVAIREESDIQMYTIRIGNRLGRVLHNVTLIARATHPVQLNVTSAPERHDVSCESESISVFVPTSLLSHTDHLTWRDPHCKVPSNTTHFISSISHTECGTTVIFTNDEVIFQNELIIHSSGANPTDGAIDFGKNNPDIIPVKCVYPRRQNITTAYRPAQSHVRFYEKRYGHLDVEMVQYESQKFEKMLPSRTFPMEVEINKDIFLKLHAMHTKSADVAIKVDSCVATPSISPADSLIYQLIDHGCAASPAIKIYNSSFDEFRFSVKAFEFRSKPGSIVYIHCQVSVCSPTSPGCVTGCASRHRREAVQEEDSAHLVSGGPYLLIADKGSLQMSTVVAAVCACLAVVATVVAIIGWRRKARDTSSALKL